MEMTPLSALPSPTETTKPYVSATSKTIPGTFVPDIEADETTAPNVALLSALAGEAGAEPTFKKTLESMLSDVSEKMSTAEQATNDMVLGKRNDIERVVTTVHEAQLSEQFMLAMRNKLLEAYTDIKSMTM
jgi:flagellar hook-basal body complex protein FliE